MVSKNAQELTPRDYLKHLKENWDKTMNQDSLSNFTGRKIKGSEYIDYWFNAYYFHSNIVKENKLNDINIFISDKMSRFNLYTTVIDAAATVGGLYQVLERLSLDCLEITIPRFYSGINS
ncbi:MAG: hypothetical protein KKF98_10280 [Bacteroidetes bacterium]|nr:hypothetical protein [Bacteroidota bacterium]